MRTPNQAFKDMCPVHGQIWVTSKTGWQCIRKTRDGVRYVDYSKTEPPLDVRELLSLTNSSWAYFDILLGRPELLVTKVQLADLESRRTKSQLVAEEARIKTMLEERQLVRQEVVQMVREELASKVKFSDIMSFHEPDSEDNKFGSN